ncbi:MAG: DUF2281 domain-containing protein [Prevotellaceae bacterium]|nr:DUF2281 domain-containing protein [Prevotellaceae bacterium]
MEISVLYEKVHQLPFSMQQEVLDYIEFLLHKSHQHISSRKPFAGCMKGTFTYMSDDFNAPLDDFNEYM